MSAPSKESQDESAPSSASANDTKKDKPKRTPLPFWRMIREDDTEYWRPFVKGEGQPVPENPTDRPGPNDASAHRPIDLLRLASRLTADGDPFEPIDSSTHRRCGECHAPYPLADFVRSSNKFGVVKDAWQSCNKCARRKRPEKMSDEDFAKQFQGSTE